jgi:hypothetical protein
MASVPVPWPNKSAEVINDLLPAQMQIMLGIFLASNFSVGRWVSYDGNSAVKKNLTAGSFWFGLDKKVVCNAMTN